MRRVLGATVLLVALLLQALAPYLPMPAMGGATSWDLMASGLEPCPMHPSDAAQKAPAKAPQDGSCSVCSVLQQAGSTLAAAEVALACHPAFLQVERDGTRDTQVAQITAHAFSSRAPPRTA